MKKSMFFQVSGITFRSQNPLKIDSKPKCVQKRPQDAPKTHQDAPKTPQDDPKTAPRRPQDGPPKRVALLFFRFWTPRASQDPPGPPETPPKSIFETILEPTWLRFATQNTFKDFRNIDTKSHQNVDPNSTEKTKMRAKTKI